MKKWYAVACSVLIFGLVIWGVLSVYINTLTYQNATTIHFSWPKLGKENVIRNSETVREYLSRFKVKDISDASEFGLVGGYEIEFYYGPFVIEEWHQLAPTRFRSCRRGRYYNLDLISDPGTLPWPK